jgi:hypothetical protein
MHDKNKPTNFVSGVVGAAIGAAGVAAAVALSKKENRDKVKKVFSEAKTRINQEAKKLQKKVDPVVDDIKKTVSEVKTKTNVGGRKNLPPSSRT